MSFDDYSGYTDFSATSAVFSSGGFTQKALPAPDSQVKGRGRGRGTRGRGAARGATNVASTVAPTGPKTQNHDLAKEDANKIRCKTCNIFCVGIAPYKAHLEGARHKKNTELEQQGEAPVGKKSTGKHGLKVIRIQPTLDACTDPLIGLEWVTEHTKEDPEVEARYVCEPCQAKCDPNTVIKHITGSKHRNNYLQEHEADKLKETMAVKEGEEELTKKSEKNVRLEKLAKEFEEKNGRKKMKMKKEFDPFFNHNQKVQENAIIAKLERKVAYLEKQLKEKDRQAPRGFDGGSSRGRGRGSFERSSRGGDRGFGRSEGGRGGSRGRGGDTRSARGGGRGRGSNMGQGRDTAKSFPMREGYGNYTDNYGDYGYEPPAKRGRGSGSSNRLRPYNDYDNGSYSYQSDYDYSGYGYGDSYGGQFEDNSYGYYDQAAPAGRSLGGGGGRSSGSITGILQGLSGTLVNSEEQASRALEISNNLTHALMQYRLKNVPTELRDKLPQGAASTVPQSSSYGQSSYM